VSSAAASSALGKAAGAVAQGQGLGGLAQAAMSSKGGGGAKLPPMSGMDGGSSLPPLPAGDPGADPFAALNQLRDIRFPNQQQQQFQNIPNADPTRLLDVLNRR
jgi:hypothetical protein